MFKLAKIKSFKPWQLRKRTWAAIITLGLIIYVLRLLSEPSVGHQVAVDRHITKAPTKRAPQLPAQGLTNPYFSINLPPGYTAQKSTVKVPGLLFHQSLIKPSSLGSLIVNLAVRNMPEGGLGEDSDYRLRQQKPGFNASQVVYNGEPVTIVNNAGAAAVVAFWPHAGLLGKVSVAAGVSNPSDSDNQDELRVIKTLLGAWQWRN